MSHHDEKNQQHHNPADRAREKARLAENPQDQARKGIQSREAELRNKEREAEAKARLNQQNSSR